MKKCIALLLTALLLAGLCACGGHDEAAAPTAEPTEDPALAASQSDAALAAQNTPPASGTDAVPSGDMARAMEYVGQPVEELYAALGQPAEEPVYGPSCLTEGAEDGILTYPGFYVWTVRTADGETVQDVYPAEEPVEEEPMEEEPAAMDEADGAQPAADGAAGG